MLTRYQQIAQSKSIKQLKAEEEYYMKMCNDFNKSKNPSLTRRISDKFHELCKAWDRIRRESMPLQPLTV